MEVSRTDGFAIPRFSRARCTAFPSASTLSEASCTIWLAVLSMLFASAASVSALIDFPNVLLSAGGAYLLALDARLRTLRDLSIELRGRGRLPGF